MPSPQYQSLMQEQPQIDLLELERAARLLRQRSGIVLGTHKHEMAARTLDRRAQRIGVASAADYLAFLEQNPQSTEWNAFVNAFTINHTAFFREKHHFELLADFVRGRETPVSIWTSAASTGEEAYSIAITLQESMPQAQTRCSILATDIDTRAIESARAGMYSMERVASIPEPLLKKYFYRGKGAKAGLVRVKPVLHDMIRFEPFNLISPSWPTEKFDAIFCRNTMIYFDKQTQSRVLERFAAVMKPGGLLFAGHSENLTYLTKAFKLRGQTVYVAV